MSADDRGPSEPPEWWDAIPVVLQRILVDQYPDQFDASWISEGYYTPEAYRQWQQVGAFGYIFPASLAPSYAMGLIQRGMRAGQIPGAPDTWTYAGRQQMAQVSAANYALWGQMYPDQTAYYAMQQNLWQARAAYWQFQQQWTPMAEAWSAVRLGTFMVPELAWVRVFGFTFYGAAQKIGAAAQMAPYIQQAMAADPTLTTQKILGGAPGALTGPFQYQPYAAATIQGLGEWTALQSAWWGVLGRGNIRQGLGINILQGGMGMTMDVLSTMAARSIVGLPLMMPEEQWNVALQLTTGVGAMAGGLGLQFTVGGGWPKWGAGAGLMSGMGARASMFTIQEATSLQQFFTPETVLWGAPARGGYGAFLPTRQIIGAPQVWTNQAWNEAVAYQQGAYGRPGAGIWGPSPAALGFGRMAGSMIGGLGGFGAAYLANQYLLSPLIAEIGARQGWTPEQIQLGQALAAPGLEIPATLTGSWAGAKYLGPRIAAAITPNLARLGVGLGELSMIPMAFQLGLAVQGILDPIARFYFMQQVEPTLTPAARARILNWYEQIQVTQPVWQGAVPTVNVAVPGGGLIGRYGPTGYMGGNVNLTDVLGVSGLNIRIGGPPGFGVGGMVAQMGDVMTSTPSIRQYSITALAAGFRADMVWRAQNPYVEAPFTLGRMAASAWATAAWRSSAYYRDIYYPEAYRGWQEEERGLLSAWAATDVWTGTNLVGYPSWGVSRDIREAVWNYMGRLEARQGYPAPAQYTAMSMAAYERSIHARPSATNLDIVSQGLFNKPWDLLTWDQKDVVIKERDYRASVLYWRQDTADWRTQWATGQYPATLPALYEEWAYQRSAAVLRRPSAWRPREYLQRAWSYTPEGQVTWQPYADWAARHPYEYAGLGGPGGGATGIMLPAYSLLRGPAGWMLSKYVGGYYAGARAVSAPEITPVGAGMPGFGGGAGGRVTGVIGMTALYTAMREAGEWAPTTALWTPAEGEAYTSLWYKTSVGWIKADPNNPAAWWAEYQRRRTASYAPSSGGTRYYESPIPQTPIPATIPAGQYEVAREKWRAGVEQAQYEEIQKSWSKWYRDQYYETYRKNWGVSSGGGGGISFAAYEEEVAAKTGFYAWLPTIEYYLEQIAPELVEEEALNLIDRGLGDKIIEYQNRRWGEGT